MDPKNRRTFDDACDELVRDFRADRIEFTREFSAACDGFEQHIEATGDRLCRTIEDAYRRQTNKIVIASVVALLWLTLLPMLLERWFGP